MQPCATHPISFFTFRILFPGALFLLLAAAFLPVSLYAEEPAASRPLMSRVKDWQAILERHDKALNKGDVEDDRILEIRTELVSLHSEARTAIDQAIPEVESIRQELATLGPAPAEGAPPEAPNVAERRKSIQDRLAKAEGAIKEAELVITRADRLIERVQALRRTRFTERVLTRGPSPLSPEVWRKAIEEARTGFALQREQFAAWLSSDTTTAKIRARRWQLPLGVVLAVIMAWPLRRWLIRRFGYVTLVGEPSYGQRLRTALVTGILRTLLPSAAVLALYLGIASGDLLPDTLLTVVRTTAFMLVMFFFVVAFCRAALAPEAAPWRLVQVGDPFALTVSRIVTALAAVFAIDAIIGTWSGVFEWSIELTLLHHFFIGALISALLLHILRRRVYEPEFGQNRWLGLRYALTLLVYAIPVSALLGYVVLSRLLAIQLVLSIGLYVLVRLLNKIAAEIVEQVCDERSPIGMRLQNALGLSAQGLGTVGFWLTGLVQLVITLGGVLALLILWGAGRSDLQAWLHTVIFGFKVGEITISLADLLFGLLLFLVLLTATRLIQRTLEQRLFPRTRLDPGLQHSIRATVGYIGVLIALGISISAAGFDLSHVALIAGALSVGIGFGLQNVVNNFVSGLILLVERPIKVGDWIVVGDVQGYVRKISVRATEVLTFDRASVFIPNSNLIAAPVMNRTYADKVGRIVIPVGFSYGTDARRVHEVLLQVARSHPDVLPHPAPMVLFKEFGASSLNFEVVAFVDDVDKLRAVTSDLCTEIDAACRREGLKMPFPQRDVHLDFDPKRLERLLAALREPPSEPAAAARIDESEGPR
ncbi:MAG TPA: DUF3772 domain-containing protein [Methylococcus sp.]|nr:DUF3772 domain-containing protein [Methylococcus sp.]